MGGSGIYLYGVIEKSNHGFNIKGIDGINNVYDITYHDIAAIVSNVNLDEFGEDTLREKSEDIEWLKKYAQIHMDIIKEIMSYGTFIPFKFCTIFLSRDNIINFLGTNYETLKSELARLNGKEEWSLKVYCDIKKFIENQMKEEIKKMEESAAKKSKGAAYFMKKKLESDIENIAKDKIYSYMDQIYNEIIKQAVDGLKNKLLARELTQKKEPMFLNASYLINKENVNNFINLIENLKKEYSQKNILIEYSGPWPLFSFVKLTLK